MNKRKTVLLVKERDKKEAAATTEKGMKRLSDIVRFSKSKGAQVFLVHKEKHSSSHMSVCRRLSQKNITFSQQLICAQLVQVHGMSKHDSADSQAARLSQINQTVNSVSRQEFALVCVRFKTPLFLC